MKNKILFLLVLSFVGLSMAKAQNKSISSSIEPKQILIGQQAVIDVKVNSVKGELVLFPNFTDTIVTGLEVLDIDLPIDTLITDKGWTLTKKYVVTSFDSLDYHIPFIPAIVGIDTLRTDTMSLIVREPILSDTTLTYIDNYMQGKIDSLNFAVLGVNDIKPVIVPPFVLMDYAEYIAYPFLAILIIALIVALIIFAKRKKKKGYYFTPKIVLPADVLALNALDSLKEKQLVQKGMLKEYHTEISDILRTYIKTRFGVDATEMLTNDIVKSLNKLLKNRTEIDKVKTALELADLVKFAKFEPLTNENDKSLSDSYEFVKETRIVEEEKTEGDPKTVTKGRPQGKKKKNKRNN